MQTTRPATRPDATTAPPPAAHAPAAHPSAGHLAADAPRPARPAPRPSPRVRPVRRVGGVLGRLLAIVALVGGLLVLPLVVWTVVGGPGAIDWSGVVGNARGGRIDADTVVALGLLVFTLLWAWFAITAVTEVARVLAWRREPAAVLPPTDPTPSGAIRRLVRAALVSTSTVVGASLATLSGTPGAGAAAPAPVVSVAVAAPSSAAATVASVSGEHALAGADRHHTDPTGPTSLRSTGRETPYSVAVRLGDPAWRDVIIELNHGAPTPDGGTWTGGVFPVGMEVSVPAGLLGTGEVTWQPYTVQAGDSVYRIATRLAAGDHTRVRDLADRIIERNLGRTMVDGRVFDDPSLIAIGWVIDVPGIASNSTDQAPVHLVEPGESYWSIAEQHVDPPGDPAEVAALTDELIDRNAVRLGHDLPQMLHPGDLVELPEPSVLPSSPVPVVPAAPTAPEVLAAPDAAVDAIEPVGTPDVVITAPAAPATPVTPATQRPGHDATTETTDAAESSGSGGRPAAAPTPDGPSRSDASVDAAATRAPVTTSLAAAVLLCAGVLGLAESRRRQQLRRAGTRGRLADPSPRAQRVERLLRSLDATQRAVRLDLALRSAGHALVGTGGFVLAAIVADDGAVTLVLDRPGRVPTAPWIAGEVADRWLLPAEVDDTELAPTARLAGQPCPAVVHLGRVTVDAARDRQPLLHAGEAGPAIGGELFVDLEAFGLVCLEAGPDADDADTDAVLRAIATSLAASPVGETLRLITHDLDTAVHLGNLNAEAADDLDGALDLAASALGSTPTAIGHRRTAELRARGIGGEAWEPVVVVSGAERLPADALRELVEVTRGGGRGLAVVLRQAVDGASLTVRASRAGWQIDRLGLTVIPVGLDLQHVHDVRHLLYTADQPLLDVAGRPDTASPGEPFVEPDWGLMVRVLGGVDVVDRAGAPVPFDRGKSLELVAWLVQHREHGTRGGARAALWEMDVRDATFANVVSDARRSLARAVAPRDGEEWIARTLTDELPVHPQVCSDAELLRLRLTHSRGCSPREAIEILQPGVALIRDHPFSGTDYLWPDAEGITSALTLLATAASTELARHHLALGDVDGVFWATGQGLKVLPGHEELIGLRMRAHAQRGDLAGVRHEWDAYERAVTSDAWSDGEPSPKLLALRKELLQR